MDGYALRTYPKAHGLLCCRRLVTEGYDGTSPSTFDSSYIGHTLRHVSSNETADTVNISLMGQVRA